MDWVLPSQQAVLSAGVGCGCCGREEVKGLT